MFKYLRAAITCALGLVFMASGAITLDFNVASTFADNARLTAGSAPLVFSFSVDAFGSVELVASTSSSDSNVIHTVTNWNGFVGTVADETLFGTGFTLEANAANASGNANTTLQGNDTGVMAIQGQNSGRIDGLNLATPKIESLDWTVAGGDVAVEFLSWDWGNGAANSDMIVVDTDSTNRWDNMGVSGSTGLSGITLKTSETVSFAQPTNSNNGVGLAGLVFEISALDSEMETASVQVVDVSMAVDGLASDVNTTRSEAVTSAVERRIDWSTSEYLFDGSSPGSRIYGGAAITTSGDSLLDNTKIQIDKGNGLVVRVNGGSGPSAARALFLWDSAEFLTPGASFAFDDTSGSSFMVEAGSAYFGPGGTRYVIRNGGTYYVSSLEGITASSGTSSIDGTSPGLQWASFNPAAFASFDTDAPDLGLPGLGSFSTMTFSQVTGVGLLCESYRSSFTRLEIGDFEVNLIGTPPDTSLPGYGSHPFEVITTQLDPASGNVTVSWEAALNQRFTVERNSDLTDPEWVVLASNYPPQGADGNTVSYVDTTAVSNQNFYRVSRPYDPAKPLNVLMIVVDDLRDHEAFAGNNAVQMPNLDRFAAKGIKFSHAFCQATYCNPSRASFLTGLLPETLGVLNNQEYFRTNSIPAIAEAVTLPQCFRSNGYYTVSLGKIFHGNQADPLSWDLQNNSYDQPGQPDVTVNMTHNYSDPLSWCRWGDPDCEDHELSDGAMAEHAVEILYEKRTDPFFLAVGFKKPHDPFIAPKKYFDLYPTNSLMLHVDPLDATPAPAEAIPTGGGSYKAFEAMDDSDRLEFLRSYAACSTYADAQIGKVFDAMDELGLWQNTIVVLFTDHGYHQGERGWWNKTLLFDYDTKVPLMAYVPEMAYSDLVCTGVVELIDLYPTLAELAGLTPPANLEGDSFASLIHDPMQPWDEVAYSIKTAGSAVQGRSICDGRYRYTEWPNGDKELYDHATDPGEWYNLSSDLSYASLMNSLSQHLQ